MGVNLLYDQIERECRANAGKNVLTALKNIKKYCGVDAVSALLDDDLFEGVISKVQKGMSADGKKGATIQSSISNLRKLSSIARDIAKPEILPTEITEKDLKGLSFSKALLKVFELAYPNKSPNYCAIQLESAFKSTAYAMKKSAILDWVYRDITPKFTAEGKVKAIEAFFKLPENSLVSKITLKPVKPKKKYEVQKRLSISLQDAPKLNEQLDDMFRFYKYGEVPACRKPCLAAGNADMLLQGGEKWKVRRNHVTGEMESQTEKGYRTTLVHFFSWLHFEHGVMLEQLDLSMLFYDKLYSHYRVFLVKNNFGVTQIDDLIKYTLAGIRGANRYLYRYHVPSEDFKHSSVFLEAQYPNGLPIYSDNEAWERKRATVISNLELVANDAARVFNKGKSEGTFSRTGGRSNILWMESYPTGVTGAVNEVLWRAIDDLSQCNSGYKLAMKQVAAWLALELVTPLRVTNTLELVLLDSEPTSTEYIYQPSVWFDRKGDFRVFVPLIAMKNGKNGELSEQLDDIDVTIPRRSKHFKVINGYAKNRAASLAEKGKESDFFFCCISDKLGEPQSRKGFGERVKRLTYSSFVHLLGEDKCKKIGVEFGLNPHSLRHIVALSILENHVCDYALVAHVLMDSVETIMREYGRNNHKNQKIRYSQIMFGAK